MLTVHERLTAAAVLLHPPRRCALARRVAVRLDCRHNPPEAPLQLPSRPPLQPKPPSAQPDSSTSPIQAPPKANWRRFKSHT